MGKTLDGQLVSILGLGASGIAAARLALTKGGQVYVSEVRKDSETSAAGSELRALGADVELGEHNLKRIIDSDAVVVSPGISPDTPVLRELRRLGIRWISEVELGYRFLAAPLIAVTGTNGKTTVAALTAHLLQEGGFEVALGGNIGAEFGPPVSELALRDSRPDWAVVELSSFQLADIDKFRPDIGILTNLAPDHLDRYESLEHYYGDKARLFDNADLNSRWVLPANSPEIDTLAEDVPGDRFYFSASSSTDADRPVAASVDGPALTLNLDGSPEVVCEPADMPLLGTHNIGNAAAAMLAAALAGVEVPALRSGLMSFQPLPHRLEPLGEREGVLWVNDSKGTNVASTASALLSLDRPVLILLGGKDKGEDFGSLRSALSIRARCVVVYGEVRERLATELADIGSTTELIVEDQGFDAAVRRGASQAREGEVLLLSPATSSYDEFRNYAERGERFRQLFEEAA